MNPFLSKNNINSPVLPDKSSEGIISNSFYIQINSSQEEQIPLLKTVAHFTLSINPHHPYLNLWSPGIKNHTTSEKREKEKEKREREKEGRRK